MPAPTTSSPTSNVGPAHRLEVDALLDGIKWGGSVGTGVTLSYSFPWTSLATAVFAGPGGVGPYSQMNEPLAGAGLSPLQQAAARKALQAWGDVANIVWLEVAETSAYVGDIRLAWTALPQEPDTAAWAYMPEPHLPRGGDIWFNSQPAGGVDPDWSVGSFNYMTLLHEIGHALGFKHPFEGAPRLPIHQATLQYTVMAYDDHPHGLFVRVSTRADGTHSWNSFHVQPDTPMLYDMLAIQHLYGANMSHRTGNDVYTFDPATPFFRTLWDAGGTDTISLANFSAGSLIDLNEGRFSSITIRSDTGAGIDWRTTPPPPPATYDGTDNLAIAYGTVIENAIGGSGNDMLVGNRANNTLDGGPGLDVAGIMGLRTAHVVTASAYGHSVTGPQGHDSLQRIERLWFEDQKIALDLGAGQSAGNAVKILGAAFGPSFVGQANLVGIGIWIFDAGHTMLEVAELALGAALPAGGRTHANVVTLLYNNLTHTQPSAPELAYFVHLLDSGAFTQAGLAVLAAETQLNAVNINLVGLASTGVEYMLHA